MRKQYKTAFTLAEMLIALAIIGILMAIAVSIMRPQDMGRRAQIASALYNFDTAMYNSYSNYKGSSWETQPFNAKNTQGLAEHLCTALTSYLNTSANNCGKATAMTLEKASKNETFKKDSAERAKYLQFTTISGFDVFITNRFSHDGKFPFYIIFIDVNGSKGPNSTLYTQGSGLVSTKYPDIYPFAVLHLGRVIPMGITENDTKLLTAKMNYIDATNTGEYPSTTYAKAKSQAWGFYTSFKTNNGEYVNTDVSDESNEELQEEPYAYNDYIRNVAGGYEFLKVVNLETGVFSCPHLSNSSENSEKYHYDGSCGVEVDRYSF